MNPRVNGLSSLVQQIAEFVRHDAPPAFTDEMVNEALSAQPADPSELLLLHFALDSDGRHDDGYLDATCQRIANAIYALAESGDEDANMCATALAYLGSDDADETTVVLGAALFQAVVSQSILRHTIDGAIDRDASAGALIGIKMLAEELAGGLFNTDEMPSDEELDRIMDMDHDQFRSWIADIRYDSGENKPV